MSLSLTPPDGLVALMIAISASDERLPTTQLLTINRIVNHLPVFADYDQDRIRVVAEMVFDLLTEEDGLDALFGMTRDGAARESERDCLCTGLRRRRRRWFVGRK